MLLQEKDLKEEQRDDSDEMQKMSMEDRLKDDLDMEECENEKPKSVLMNIEAMEKDAEDDDDKEHGEMEIEHRKKRTREKDEFMEIEEISSWEKGEGVEMDIMSNKRDTEEGEKQADEAAEGKTSEQSDITVKQEAESGMEVEESVKRTSVKEENSMVTEISDGKIKIEGDVICVPSGLTVTKAEIKEDGDVKEDSLSAVKVEIKSDLFSTELNAIKKEDKGIGTSASDNKEKDVLYGSKPKLEDGDDKIPAAFLVHRPIQFERLGECMEKANAEVGPVIVPNGDKFNALNHLYNLNSSSVFSNGKELNGNFLLGSTTGGFSSEKNWFSILPRDACDSTSVTNGTCLSR